MTTKQITDKLSALEQQYKVKVLYACETGSRVWGFPSPDSDYDVRVIYKHNIDWYLSLSEQKDTIEFMSADGQMDISGWDIRKCLKLMWKSNGALLERVQSPIIYQQVPGLAAAFRAHAFSCYSPITTMHHYLGMAKNSFADVDGQETVKLKKLFYALRAAIACKWINDQDTPPPIVFMTMVNELNIDETVRERIITLIDLKAGKPESYIHPAEPALNELIAGEIANADNAFNSLPGRSAKDADLDKLFRQIVKTD